MEELRTCKKKGYEYYCEELFVVKSKSKYSCAGALYFQLDRQTIKKIVYLTIIIIKQM